MHTDKISRLNGVFVPTCAAHQRRRCTFTHPAGYRTIRVRDVEIDDDVRIPEAEFRDGTFYVYADVSHLTDDSQQRLVGALIVLAGR